MDASVLIPITFWSTSKPLFRISTVCITPNFKKLVTGSYNGQLCLWDLNVKRESVTPRNILVGHTDTVTCMASTNEYLISSCEGKVMCRWNLDDGYCSKSNLCLFIHRKMQLILKSESNEEFLFTCGDYSEIFVIHPFTLQVIFIFHSKSSNAWVSSFQVITSQDNQIVSGITATGCVKLWRFDDFINEAKCETDLYSLPTTNVVDFKYNSSCTEVLIVSTNCWMLYDSEYSNCISKIEANNGEKLLGGNFCNSDVIVWTNSGKFYMYNVNKSAYKLICVFLDSFSQVTVFQPALSLIQIETENYLIKGDAQGRITFWKIESQEKESHPVFSTTLSDNWVTSENGFFNSFLQYSTVTCCIYVLEIDKFFVGCFDGSIISIPGTESLMSFYFNSVIKKPLTDTFIGHKGKINCLLYPHEKYSYFNKSYLVSGGSDFSVCLWDIFKGELLFNFCVQSGEILRLIVPPKEFNMPVRLSICSISSDHSVAVLNLKDKRCLILTSRHEFPVVTVHWKPLDDFIIIECFDGTIYVWQIETGHLDRVLYGVTAQEVIYACNEPKCNSTPALNFYIHEQHDTKKNSMKQKVFSVLGSTNSSPFTLNRFLTSETSESHIFLCNLENVLTQFSCDFKSEASECAIRANAYLLTRPPVNDSHKKSSVSVEKINSETESFQEKLENQKNNNVKSIPEDRITSPNDVKYPMFSEGILNLIQFFLSSIHLWGLNPRLDELLSSKLGLLKPEKSVCFAISSQPGIYSLFLPTAEGFWQKKSSLFASICVAMLALSKTLPTGKTVNEDLTETKRNWWEELSSFYDLTAMNLNKDLEIPKPKIEILARAWQAKCLPFQEVTRKLLCNYLQALDGKENADLLEFWYKYLPHFKTLDKTLPEKVDFENVEFKTVALVLFGIVGSDLKFKSSDSSCQENYVYQTCASFVYLMLLPVSQRLHFSTLQTIAIDFIGRGYIVWEQFLKMEKIVPILFKICANFGKGFNLSDLTDSVCKCFAARKTLKSIAIARTAAFINCLKNEITQNRFGQNHYFLTDSSKAELLSILTFLLEKTPYIMLLYLNDVISVIIYCLDVSHLRQENLANLIPVMQKFRQVHHSVASQRIAVGLATGSLVLHDLKTGKVHEVPAHKDSVSALKFSEDGKSLVSYSCYENKLSFWQVLTGIFGLGNIQVKCTKSCPTYRIHDEEIRNHLEIASLTWTDKKSVMLTLCDGTKDVFHS